jgi:hypothetical protein
MERVGEFFQVWDALGDTVLLNRQTQTVHRRSLSRGGTPACGFQNDAAYVEVDTDRIKSALLSVSFCGTCWVSVFDYLAQQDGNPVEWQGQPDDHPRDEVAQVAFADGGELVVEADDDAPDPQPHPSKLGALTEEVVAVSGRKCFHAPAAGGDDPTPRCQTDATGSLRAVERYIGWRDPCGQCFGDGVREEWQQRVEDSAVEE